MLEIGLPFAFVLLLWWASTGAILYLNGLPRRTHGWSLGSATVLLALALLALVGTRDDTRATGAYLAFVAALAVWGWAELAFLLGRVTGPRREACPPQAGGWRRAWLGLRTALYHQTALIGLAGAVRLAPHPSMNLWEGNIGIQAAADFIHGSSSHNTLFRCRFPGGRIRQSPPTTTRLQLQYKNRFMNVVGCVLGTPARSNTYETAYPASGDNSRRNIWRLGYGGPSWAGDTTVKATLLRDRNFDYVRQMTDRDNRIIAVTLPPSLYRSSKPAWWGDGPWPPMGPDVPGLVNKIPAQLRYEASRTTDVRDYPVPPGADRQPADLRILQNYPNPFNPVTTIRFVLPERSHVTLTVWNALGQIVSTVVNDVEEAGYHDVQFDGSGLASRAYVVRIQAGSLAGTKRMILLR